MREAAARTNLAPAACAPHHTQLAAAIVSIAVENDGDRGYTSFVLLLIELNLVVW